MFCKLFVLAALVACAATTPKPGDAAVKAPITPVATTIAAPGLAYGGLGYGAGIAAPIAAAGLGYGYSAGV